MIEVTNQLALAIMAMREADEELKALYERELEHDPSNEYAKYTILWIDHFAEELNICLETGRKPSDAHPITESQWKLMKNLGF